MVQSAKAIATGLAGWLLRLVFLSTVAAGAVGAYIAMIAAISAAHPAHDRLLGLTVMGIATGVSVPVALAIRRTGRAAGPREPAALPVYPFTYLLFAVTAFAMFAVTTQIQLAVDWARSPVRVPATVSNCTSETTHDPETGPTTTYECDFAWVWHGAEHRKRAGATDVFPDGTVLSVWVNPSDGSSDDHSVLGQVVLGLASLLGLALAATLWWRCIRALRRTARFRRWLAGHAWWRDRPAPSDGQWARAEQGS
jgi:hypothetical protein